MTARSTTDFTTLRHRMVEHDLEGRGISNPRVLAAMAEVPREVFVLEELRESAYEDQALPIGFQQTISQPYTVAFMLEAVRKGRGVGFQPANQRKTRQAGSLSYGPFRTAFETT